MHISLIDTIVIAIYLVGIVVLGIWAGVRQKREAKEDMSYFLAGRTLTWPVIGMALFSANISTVHLVSLAEEGYTNGLVYGNTEWMAGLCLILLAIFFTPFYFRSKVTTLPDFLEKRYSRPSRDWLAFLSIISAIFIHIGFTLYAAAIVMHGLFGWNILYCIIGVAILTGIYTIVGGLMAVVITETVQTLVLLAGAVILTIAAYHTVGGWENIKAAVPAVKLTMLRPTGDPSGMPWYAALLGYPIIGIWYWCTEQTIVQRVLGAKDENNAKVGPLFCGFIKILPVFFFILPGLLCLGLINQGKLSFAELESPRNTYSFMISKLLPVGLRGVMAAALLAAAMSTVSAALNSIATLFTYDLYKRWSPSTPEHKLVVIGRVVTFVGMIIAIVWSPIVGRFTTVFQGFAAMICYIAPPVTVTFLLGVFWKKASSKGSIVTLIFGSLLGLIAFLRYFVGIKTNFWMDSFYLAAICTVIHIVTSLLTPETATAEQMALVWGNPMDALKEKGWPGIGNYKLLTVLLLVILVVLYVFFG